MQQAFQSTTNRHTPRQNNRTPCNDARQATTYTAKRRQRARVLVKQKLRNRCTRVRVNPIVAYTSEVALSANRFLTDDRPDRGGALGTLAWPSRCDGDQHATRGAVKAIAHCTRSRVKHAIKRSRTHSN